MFPGINNRKLQKLSNCASKTIKTYSQYKFKFLPLLLTYQKQKIIFVHTLLGIDFIEQLDIYVLLYDYTIKIKIGTKLLF